MGVIRNHDSEGNHEVSPESSVYFLCPGFKCKRILRVEFKIGIVRCDGANGKTDFDARETKPFAKTASN